MTTQAMACSFAFSTQHSKFRIFLLTQLANRQTSEVMNSIIKHNEKSNGPF